MAVHRAGGKSVMEMSLIKILDFWKGKKVNFAV
jgi:hypothetical protein